jgi:hypothetical protein
VASIRAHLLKSGADLVVVDTSTLPESSFNDGQSMAGTLIVNERSIWMPPGWVFDNVLSDLAAELQQRVPALTARLLDGRTDRSVGYFDCVSLDSPTLRELLHAAEHVLDRTLAAGSGSFHEPSAFPGFVRHVRDLIALLREDPRAGADNSA